MSSPSPSAPPPPHPDLSSSSLTLPSTSSAYHPSSASESHSPSHSPSPAGSPVILYKPPTVWSLLRGAAINLLLPFVNGLMLGFGELLAHEAAFRLGWSGTKIFPSGRASRPAGPGIEVRENLTEKGRRGERHLDDLTSLE